MDLLTRVKMLLVKSQDNEGWVRKGKLTPVKNLRDMAGNVGNYFNSNSNNGNNFWGGKGGQTLANVQRNLPQPVQQFSQGFGNTSTYGLVDFKPTQMTPSYRAGQVIGLVNPFNPLNKGMMALNVGGRVVSKIAPKAIGLAPKIAGGLLSEGAQSLGYAGAANLGRKLGLNKQENQFEPKNLAANMLLGTTLRGVFNANQLRGVKNQLNNANLTDNKSIKIKPVGGKERALKPIYDIAKKYKTLRGFLSSNEPQNIIDNLVKQHGIDESHGVWPARMELAKQLGIEDFNMTRIWNQAQSQPTIKVKPSEKIKITTGEGIGTQYRNLTPQGEISAPTGQIKQPIPNRPLSTNSPLSLPQGEFTPIVVKNRSQLKNVLSKNPNANVRIELKPGKGNIVTYGDIPTRKEVSSTIPTRLNNFIQDTLGYSSQVPTGGNRGAGIWTKTLRKGQVAVSTKVEQGLGSENPYIRTAASTLQNFFKGLGMSPERAKASMELRGEMSISNQRAYDVMDTLYQSLGNNKKSLERINAVLDPEISTTKVTLDQLTKTEKEVYKLIREGLDLVHDTSYANGHISPELYLKNKGKYVPRLYDITELPPEVNKFITSGKKINNDLYKQRKDVDAWKKENSLNDPVYALGKRLAQVETNSAIKKYTDFLASNPRFISDVERPGFTKLSDSPAYGALSGKYVLNSAAEDLKGFFFANQGLQNLYDVFRAYDRLGIRQLQKKLLTVFNPTTNVGNIVSDQVFGFLTGVDPLTLNKNLSKLDSNPAEFKRLIDYLTRQGITRTDITRTDFVNKLASIDELSKGMKPGKISVVTNKIQSFYGDVDDAYKVAALKSLLDKGFSLEEATRKVADGFQNYANVGKFYDLWAKTPIIGKPFIKFQGDLIRIIKNSAVNNPLGLIGFLGTLWGIAQLSSKLSGETPEDYKTRTERFAAPMIPGLNIPLTWQTPIGEINVARYISPFFANNETSNIASNMLPFIPDFNSKKDVASNIAMNVNDPLLSPLIQLGVNRDFRGKPISDPNENKYQPSTLTPLEKFKNQAVFAGRSYLPPPVNSLIDVPKVAITGENMYGSPQTIGQSVARLAGVKISDMSPEQVQKIRENDIKYQDLANDFIDKQINSVLKQEVKEEITPEQSIKRIQNLEKQKVGGEVNYEEKKKDISIDLAREEAKTTGNVINVGGVIVYSDKQLNTETGTYKTVSHVIDLSEPIKKPVPTGNPDVDKKMLSSYNSKINARINDLVKLVELGQMDASEAQKQINELKKQKISSGKKPKKVSIKKSTIKISKLPEFKTPSFGKLGTTSYKVISKPNIKLSSPKKIIVAPKTKSNTIKISRLPTMKVAKGGFLG